MMRLFLVEKSGGRKIDLGLYKFNDEAQCINAAKRRHKFLGALATNGFVIEGQQEPGPLRIGKAAPVNMDSSQLQIPGMTQ